MLETEDIVENILGDTKVAKQKMFMCSTCCERTSHWLKTDGEICMTCGTRR